MKRKRGAGRRKPSKNANVVGADKETDAGYQSAWSDAANDPVNTRTEVDIAQATGTTSRGPTSSSRGPTTTTTPRGPTTTTTTPRGPTTTTSRGPTATTTPRGPTTTTSRGPTTTTSRGPTTTTPRGPTTTTSRGPNAGLNNEKSNENASLDISLHGNNVFKNVASFAAKLSRAVGSSTSDPHIDARVLQDEMTYAGEHMSYRHDPLDNQKELKAALWVIETIMKMDASKPFNTPVDPVAMGIPDYFDIIDTPMDFDTICRNLDLGFKYRNSQDIYRDVELIWDNCSKYNKDGTKILELMKQVRTKFLKQWSAAGLYTPRQEPSNVHSGKSLPHPAEDSVRYNYHGHAHLDSSMISNSFHQGRPHLMGQDLHPPHPSCFSYRPPHMPSQCSCSWCFRGSHTSMYDYSWHSSPGGSVLEKHYDQRQFEPSFQHEHSHHPQVHDRWWQHQPSFDPHQASLQKARMNSQYPGSSNAYSNQQMHRHMYPSHTDGYHPKLTHADDLQHHSNTPLSPCHAPGVPSAGHQHLNMHTEAVPRHTKRVREDLTALDPDGPSVQKYQRVVATQATSCSRIHSPARHEERSGSAGRSHLNLPVESIPRHTKSVHEDLTALDSDGPSIQKHQRVAATQVTSGSRQNSPTRHEENSGSAGRIHVTPARESSVRPHTYRTESSIAPDTNNCSSEEYDMDRTESDSPLSDDNAIPEPEEDARLSQPGSRTPEEDAHLSQPGSRTPEASPLGTEHTRESPALEKKSRGRGPTRCLKLLFHAKRISITTNELGQPVGVDARQLANFLGMIARDGHRAPLNYIEWRAMPEALKENMWKEVQEKFIIDPKSKNWVMKSLSKKWKDWKARLKSERYLTRATNEERLANLDERVHPDQWAYLVSHWNTEKAERRSATNKACAKLVLRHVGGSKSYACLREEEKEKRPDKKPPTRAELFIMTRVRKNGKPVNEETAAIIEKLRQTQDAAEASMLQDEAFAEVVGRRKNGHVRCDGLNLSPSDLVLRKNSSREYSQDVANQMVAEAKAEVLEMKNKMGTMEKTCAQMATQMAAMMSMMSSLHKDMHGPAPNVSGTGEELSLQQRSPTPPTACSSRKTRPPEY